MHIAAEMRVLIFLTLVAGVYVLAASVVLRKLAEKTGRIKPPARAGIIWLQRGILGLAAGGILCGLYGYFIEPYWPQVTRIKLQSRKLATAQRAVRLIHISDIHSDPKARLEERLPDLIAAEKPDLIVFSGDSLNSPAGLTNFRNCLTRIAKIAPTYVVRGNWDTNYWFDIDLFGGTGAQELQGVPANLEISGAKLRLHGLPIGSADEKRLEGALGKIDSDVFNIFLYHYPDLIPEVAARQVDLYCAGHTHGGQVALPLYGALITLSKFDKQFEAGLYRVADTWLYVNRGIGMEGGVAPRVRFWARPEITVLEIGP